MRAISLWQPWASAIALGAKCVETRSWPTDYRGPLAIHAAQRCVMHEMIGVSSSWTWCGALGHTMGAGVDALVEKLPFGAIVAICTLADCKLTDHFTLAEIETKRTRPGFELQEYRWSERQMGDYALGRFGWILKDVISLPVPIPRLGRQGFFQVDDSLLHAALGGAL